MSVPISNLLIHTVFLLPTATFVKLTSPWILYFTIVSLGDCRNIDKIICNFLPPSALGDTVKENAKRFLETERVENAPLVFRLLCFLSRILQE